MFCSPHRFLPVTICSSFFLWLSSGGFVVSFLPPSLPLGPVLEVLVGGLFISFCLLLCPGMQGRWFSYWVLFGGVTRERNVLNIVYLVSEALFIVIHRFSHKIGWVRWSYLFFSSGCGRGCILAVGFVGWAFPQGCGFRPFSKSCYKIGYRLH